ncbi:uncharacterized protein LOC135949893 [Calliphora vicina]|uniref:uncharacterized protein LOC135949893 n=1 Tax=Calliphora vicina TaxID=7373 RepID=UPI00325AE375
MEQLKRKRTQLKKSITRLYNFISGPNANYNDIKVRIDEFESVFMKYKDIQDEIDGLCENEIEIQREDSYRNEIEETYFSARSIYSSFTQENLDNTMIEGAAASTPQLNNDLTALLQTMSTTLTSVVNLQSSNMNDSNHNNNSGIRLPQIQIPDFDGNLSNWIRFRDLFNAMVDARTNLSEVEKLEYLQTKLKGEASSIIKHLTPTNSNYRIAWDLVKRKFDRPDQIRETYIRLLLTQPSVKNGTLSEIKQFYNNTVECYNALTILYESVASWDPLLLFLIREKLDRETITLWYRQQNEDNRQSFQKLLDFLENRLIELESLDIPNQSSKFRKANKFVTMTTTTQSCPVCKKDHFLFACQQFKDLTIEKRRNMVLKSGFCFNCLKEKHLSKDCKSSSCRTCGLKHNTLLHVNTNQSRGIADQPHVDPNGSSSITINSSQQTTTHQTTLLPTAVIMVRDKNNSLQPCRALMDSGAQSTLISEACVQRLHLNRSYDKTALCGVGGNNTSYTRGKVQLEIFAKDIGRTIIVQTYCLSNLTQYIPSQTIVNQGLEYFQSLKLADPAYHKPNRIDIILGADVFPHCILDEKVSHPSGSPTALSTIFGWVIMGNVNKQPEMSILIAHVHTGLDEQLQRFWEIEQCEVQSKHLTPDEEHAEQHFMENVQKQSDGRYMVKLPFKTNDFQLGESKKSAMQRLESMERQFCRNVDLKAEFHEFMNEYIQLNHMQISPNGTEQQVYYMPHHAVLKPSSTTTKLRVVFDASCKSSNNTSLNDHLLVGPTVQNDLYSILLKFRRHRIGFTADIEKMYRQVLIHPDDRSYQSILWRDSTKDPPTTYQLKTVTYGTASAPFLATRTLMQVALDNSQEFPKESSEIINNFYVDDYMSSAPNVGSACSRHATLCSILSKSGFNLRKWSTNSRELLESIEPQDRACSSEMIIDQTETVKTLGLLWNTSTDCFQYSVCFQQVSEVITKRRVLSDISRIYDPIGWLSPVLIKMKIFMQKLWIKGVNWDQDLPSDLKAEWLQLQNNVENIRDLQIPRWFNFNVGDGIELHGFADSSELAYSAAIYVRVIKPDGSMITSLITSKTRVTPIRQITLPRLELCAAHLMVKVMVKVKQALELQNVPTYGWTDSTVVLAWLRDHPRRWKTFIANRTSHIINVIPASQWRHITSKQNPADLATRGISSAELKDNNLWWQGPHILQSITMEATPTTSTEIIPKDIDLEERKVIATATSVKQTDLFELFSSYNVLLRVTALILRFVGNCKCKSQRQTGFITTMELQNAHRMLVRKAQHESYTAEIRTLTHGNQLPSGNKLTSLSPFLDNFGILRVGGRLENASISYDQKHPYILHRNHILTQLIVRHFHTKHLHAGKRQLQYSLGLKYWIPEVFQVIKRTIYQCTTCLRFRQRPFQQRMGDLPSCRLQPGSTFLYVGIDFAGPMFIRSWKGRGSRTYKCWLAVFVCLNTKAIHLEPVTDLSTPTFLASFRRFTSRRGTPLHVYTDNGTNFVGCNRELKELYDFLITNYPYIQKEMSNEQIQWHFIPPSAPNFGGIWEAGVKSVKFHMKRVLGNSSTTYEELSTLLCQIECCLNSRPLCLKFEGDIDPLTPAHFLILRSMKSIPDENLIDVNVSRLSRWQYIQSLVQQFWSKWSNEYLSQLQQRPKWRRKIQNLQIDDIVLIKEENLPPTQWLMGRIICTHPGKDNIVRVVSLRTTKGILKRPISKICPLLMDC